jgi:hypothetical protein
MGSEQQSEWQCPPIEGWSVCRHADITWPVTERRIRCPATVDFRDAGNE